MEMGTWRRNRGSGGVAALWVAYSSSISPKITFLLLFFSLVFYQSMSLSALNHTSSSHKRVASPRLARIQGHLDKINKPPVKTIESQDGDIIDCVHLYKQPALDHPLLKNHKIQRVPSEKPKWRGGASWRVYNWSEEGRRAWQTWHHKGRCPKGTVPIRRSSVDDVLRAKSLYHYGKKQRRDPFARPTTTAATTAAANATRPESPVVISGNGHEHAIAYTVTTEEMYGAKATINVWEPSIEGPDEFSLSQIWILSGSFDGDLNSIEAGWQVSPQLYGDNRPRLFTYWTSDAYQATGCYNLLCSGFVQTNNKIAIGAAISPVSSFSGNQYDITILVWKDPKLGNWWMGLGDTMLVGYWPAALFTHLSNHATMVQWGGEVVNMEPNGGHTSTQMGSGHFAEEGFGRASYFHNLEIVDADNSLTSVGPVSTITENTNCYNIKSTISGDWGTYFYYGGPGRNSNCP